jgi:hypothetical protein
MNTSQQNASISRIRDHITSYLQERKNEINNTASIPVGLKPSEESTSDATAIDMEPVAPVKKEYRGNQYDLDQFLYRQSQIQYYATLSKNKKQEVVRTHREFNSESFERTRYMKKWGRLDDFAKQVVVKKYIQELADTGKISADQKVMLTTQALDLIREKQLKKVDYDETTAKVYEIAQLGLTSLR